MEKSVLEALIRLVGPDGVVIPPKGNQVVLFPRAAEDVAGVVRLANEAGLTIAARGAGRGLRPFVGNVLVDFTRMNRVKQVNLADLYLVAEPGVTMNLLRRATEKVAFFYPVAAEEESTIGGNVGVNAMGLRGLRYGETKDYTLALEVVTTAGEVMKTGAKTFKSVSGYDLTRLFAGSRGTLGIVTEVVVRLVAKPDAIETMVVHFDDSGSVFRAAQRIVDDGITPAKLEFMDGSTLSAVADDDRFVLLLEFHGLRRMVRSDADRAKNLCWGGTISSAGSEAWRWRREALSALSSLRGGSVVLSVSVPRGGVVDFYRRSRELAKSFNLPVACFGHLGVGILHVVFSARPDEAKGARDVAGDIMALAGGLDGRVKDVFAIGLGKMSLPAFEGDEATQVLRRSIKEALDPRGVFSCY